MAGANVANRDVYTPTLSADGRFVAFVTRATNLVGFPPTDTPEVFAFDQQTSQLALISHVPSTSGTQPVNGSSVEPSLSASGRFAAYQSAASNILPAVSGTNIYVVDRDFDTDGMFDESPPEARRTVLVNIDSAGVRLAASFRPSISGTGRFVAFHAAVGATALGDTLTTPTFTSSADVYVHDRDADSDGIFDETAAGARKTVEVSVDSAGQPAAGSVTV